MAVSLESLVIEIKASNSQIVSRLDQADRKLAQFERSAVGRIAKIEGTFGKLGASISKGFALIGSAAALGGLSTMVKNALEAGDTIGDLSAKLGLSTTQFQQFQFAANQSGVETGQLDAGIRKLNLAIAESADKNSKASASFAAFGINIKDFGSTGDVFAAVMDRIANSQLSLAQQTKLLTPLLGKQSAALTVMAAEFDKLSKQAPLLSDEEIRRAGELNDEWDKMSKIISTNLTRALINLGPLLVSIAEKVANLSKNIGDFFAAFSKQQAQGNVTQLIAVEQEIRKIQAQVDAMPADGLLEGTFGGRAAAEQRLNLLKAQRDVLRETVTHAIPKERARPSLEDLAGPDITKAKKGKKGPDFEGIRNRATEEAARTEAQLQERIATITGNVTQLQITALAEVEAKRVSAFHQAKGDIEAEAAITKTAALETLGVQLNVIGQLIDADNRHVQEVEAASQRKLDAIQAEAEERRQLADTNLENIRRQQDIAVDQGAPLQRIIDLHQQEADAIRAVGAVEAEANQQRTAIHQQTLAGIQEQIDARKLLLADFEAARDAATTDLEKALAEAKIVQLNELLLTLQDRYNAVAVSIRQVGEEQRHFTQQATDGLREQIAAEETRMAILGRAISQNQNYDATQQEIENTLRRVALQQEALKLGVSPEEIASLDAILTRYQLVQEESEALNDALQRQAQEQQEMHDLVAGGISDIGHELLDMARDGEFSFKRLVDAANRFGDRLADRAFDKLADQFAEILFPTAKPALPIPTLPTQQPAISGPFEVSSLGQQLEALQVPLLSTSNAGIQQLATTGAAATQSLTQASTASLTTIQTTGTTAVTSLQTVTTTALAAIQAAAAQGAAGSIPIPVPQTAPTDLSNVVFTPGTDLSSVPFRGAVPNLSQITAPALNTIQQAGQTAAVQVGDVGQGVVSKFSTFSSGCFGELTQLSTGCFGLLQQSSTGLLQTIAGVAQSLLGLIGLGGGASSAATAASSGSGFLGTLGGLVGLGGLFAGSKSVGAPSFGNVTSGGSSTAPTVATKSATPTVPISEPTRTSPPTGSILDGLDVGKLATSVASAVLLSRIDEHKLDSGKPVDEQMFRELAEINVNTKQLVAFQKAGGIGDLVSNIPTGITNFGGGGEGAGGFFGLLEGLFGGVTETTRSTNAAALSNLQSVGQSVTQTVGQTGQSVITQTGTAGAGILGELAQFASSALSSLLAALTTQSASSSGSGFMNIFSSLFSSFGGSGGSFGNVAAGSSSTAAIIPVAHGGGTIGKTVLPTREISTAVFSHAPRFDKGGVVGGVPTAASNISSSVFSDVSYFHEGGTVNGSSVISRAVASLPIHDAPRFARGGIALSKLTPDEVPAVLHRGEIVVPAALSKRLVAQDDQLGDVMRAVAARRPVAPLLDAPPVPRFALGGLVGASQGVSMPLFMPNSSPAQAREIRQNADVMSQSWGEEKSESRRDRAVVVNINGVSDFASFKRNEQQLQASIARTTSRASRRNN